MGNKEFMKILRRLCLSIKASPEAKKIIKENVMKKLSLVLILLLSSSLLLGGCGSAQIVELEDKIDILQIEIDEGLSQIEELQIELNKATIEVSEGKAQLAMLESDLSKFSLPRNFDNEADLIEWRKEVGIVGNELSWVDSCVLLHEIALKEGYLVTLDVDIYEEELGVSLTAVAGERFYQLYPDEIEVYFIAFVY